MADYFSEYSSFVGAAKGLPSSADTPYETPGFIRSKRSSRTTATSSRDQSASPPPLPLDAMDLQEKSRDGRYSAMDPRRFTPTLHASLVSEILNLRREVDSKNSIVEDLETTLSNAKNENESLNEQLVQHAKEVRKAKTQVVQMEQGTYEAVEDLIKQREAAQQTAEDLKAKLDVATKSVRRQDEDSIRNQGLWDDEKERWENERRQLERRIHVTETRLRTFVDEMAAHQAASESHNAQVDEAAEDSTFKDSGLGNESDEDTTHSGASPEKEKHRRQTSSISLRRKSARDSRSTATSAETPDHLVRPGGHTLADELDIEEEDEYDMDEFDHADDDFDGAERDRRTMGSRQGFVAGDMDSKAKRVLGLTDGNVATSPGHLVKDTPARPRNRSTTPDMARFEAAHPATMSHGRTPTRELETSLRARYVDSGYQPSLPPSPPSKRDLTTGTIQIPSIMEPTPSASVSESKMTNGQTSPLALKTATLAPALPTSPPLTPMVNGMTWPEKKGTSISDPVYATASTQTEVSEPERPQSLRLSRQSLSPPAFVPSISIHPPSSRPSSPRPYVLPPGTRNASCQANLPWQAKDASVQTEGIRIDKRAAKLPSHLLPSYLLPSPTFQDEPPPQSQPTQKLKRAAVVGTAKIFTKIQINSSLPSPPLQSPMGTTSSRDKNSVDGKNGPMRVIPLPRPVLSPPLLKQDSSSNGPLNRSSHYGVTRLQQSTGTQLVDVEPDSDMSDYEDEHGDVEIQDLAGSIPVFSKAPPGRFGLSEPPKVVPEDKELSPERRPDTAESYGAAPAPSVASSRANSQRARTRPPPKLNAYKDLRSRSSSIASGGSSSYSAPPMAPPPFAIPVRSSSRFPPQTQSEGSASPTRANGPRPPRPHVDPHNLRKVQSATAIRHRPARTSPHKGRRRRRSPQLTPVQSMAFESPTPTQFPLPQIPRMPTPVQERQPSDASLPFHRVKGSVNLNNGPIAEGAAVLRRSDESMLVDSIAATMIGEYMWKAVRKRKSFGIGEDADDFPHHGTNGAIKITAHGTRHKRWVWLSPYERTIMWDNKQPTSGTALLGKKGRKLGIRSVLDVQDSTPLPKGAELRSAFYRSILVLTPIRALKFTCITEERHILWMTALSFLAEAESLPAQIPTKLSSIPGRVPPQVPFSEPANATRSQSPSLGRARIRDSVRLASARRPSLQKSNSQPIGNDNIALAPEPPLQDNGADFPSIPRLYVTTSRHQRKRSNTSPRLPPPLSNLRSFSSSAIPSSTSSLHPAHTKNSSFRTDLRSSSSKSGGSRRDSITSPDRPNFFEAIGTVRMEAFVDPNVRNGVLYVPAPPALGMPLRFGRLRGDSNVSTSTADKRRAGYVFDENGLDPFKGF